MLLHSILDELHWTVISSPASRIPPRSLKFPGNCKLVVMVSIYTLTIIDCVLVCHLMMLLWCRVLPWCRILSDVAAMTDAISGFPCQKRCQTASLCTRFWLLPPLPTPSPPSRSCSGRPRWGAREHAHDYIRRSTCSELSRASGFHGLTYFTLPLNKMRRFSGFRTAQHARAASVDLSHVWK